MSQLEFKQITFTNEDARGTPAYIRPGIDGKPGQTGLVNNNQYKIFRYPLDIGNYDKGHYMVIHINEQKKTFLSGGVVDGATPTVIANRATTGTSGAEALGSAIQGVNSLVNAALTGTGVSVAAGSASANVKEFLLANGGPVVDFFVGAGDAFLGEIGKIVDATTDPSFVTDFTRTIQRTKDTIVLYMPDTMAFSYSQGYNELNVGADSRLLGAIGAGVDAYMKSENDASKNPAAETAKALSPFLLSFLADRTDLGRVAFAAIQGKVLNPMIELLYTTPTLRSFSFTFAFYPRSQKEAKEINRILDCLRFHQSPEVVRADKGVFLVPPSEFDIQFYYNGRINPNIDKISTCVLESIDVDYAPNGFSAYEVQGSTDPTDGGTGMPVAIILKLNFKETEYLTKQHYKGYHDDRGQSVADGGKFDSNFTPYQAFDDANRVGLTIGQGTDGIFDSDLPTPTANFRGGP